MSCDMFSSAKAQELLKAKRIDLFGDSNMRALYKDLLWLLEDGRLIPTINLKRKNEVSHANDVRVSNGTLHSGRDYKEVRSYTENSYITFHFITRLYLTDFINTIKNLKYKPDVVAINSCVWDLTRWGSNGVEQFKKNVKATFNFLKKQLPSTRIIWLTTLPPSFKSHGGFLTKEIEFMRNMLPWHILFANKYASELAIVYDIDVLDLHYNFRFLLNYHTKDGIHWDAKIMRYATNLFLTHLALSWNFKVPGLFELDNTFLEYSGCISNSTIENKFKEKACDNNSVIIKKNHSKKKSFEMFPKYLNKFVHLQNEANKNIFINNGYQQATTNAWYEDYTFDNFQGGFVFEQNQNELWRYCYGQNENRLWHYSDTVSPYFNFNFNFNNESRNLRNNNVQNQGRIRKNKSNTKKKNNKLVDAAINMLNNM